MIRKVLERDFVLEQASRLRAGLVAQAVTPGGGEAEVQGFDAGGPAPTAAPEDDAETREAIGLLIDAFSQGGPEGELAPGAFDAAAEDAGGEADDVAGFDMGAPAGRMHRFRRHGRAADADAVAYLPEQAPHSLLQSAIEAHMRVNHPGVDLANIEGFSHSDVDWVPAITAALIELMRRHRRPFVAERHPPITPLAPDARMILVGDWGTGIDAALRVRDRMSEWIEAAGGREVHAVHLGDMYYSGTEWEAQTRFLDNWPIAAGSPHMSWALNGNHDMFSGGHGYFDVVLADERFRRQRAADGKQPLSYFHLRNEHWQVLGLDTSWDKHVLAHHGQDGFLASPQAEWIERSIASGGELGTMLLSHHQYVSRHERLKGHLQQEMAAVLAKHPVSAWLWGHEHRCQRFNQVPGVGYAACIGHGAMPAAVGKTRAEPGEWEYAASRTDEEGREWRLCGFCVLDFDGPDVVAHYVDENGAEHATEEIKR